MAAILVVVLAGFATPSPARAEIPPDQLCTRAIDAAKRSAPLPPRLLEAIAQVESGRLDPASGHSRPWPWTINANGTGYYFGSAADAVAFVKSLQDKGVRSIDVGCMQVNLLSHPDAFASLEDAFDPHANVQYAIRFLMSLYREVGNWPSAVGLYHSANPVLSATYRARILGDAPSGAPIPPRPPVITEAERERAALVMSWRATLSHDDAARSGTISNATWTPSPRPKERPMGPASRSARLRARMVMHDPSVQYSQR